MKTSDLLFTMLRNSKLLKEQIRSDTGRKLLIKLKYEYTKLQPTLRNMIKMMATDIDRFDVTNFSSDEIKNILIYSDGHIIVTDTKTGVQFKIFKSAVTANDIEVFIESEHQAFIVAVGCLVRCKERQEEIIKERDKEERKMNVLSGYQ